MANLRKFPLVTLPAANYILGTTVTSYLPVKIVVTSIMSLLSLLKPMLKPVLLNITRGCKEPQGSNAALYVLHKGPYGTTHMQCFPFQCSNTWMGLPEKCTTSCLFFINYSKVMIKVGLRFGLGLVLVLICHIRTANQLSHVESIDYKTWCGALFRYQNTIKNATLFLNTRQKG